MQEAAGAFTQDLAVLWPGLERVREKLYLALMRPSILVEGIAYSLLEIFNAAIPVIYDGGNHAVGRLLERIVAGSGDLSIFAWNRRAGSYDGCLPVDLSVYNQLVSPHVPQPIEMAEMDSILTALRSSLSDGPDLSLAVVLRGRLEELPSLIFAASRLRLPGIVFPITQLDDTSESYSSSDLHVYRAMIPGLGDIGSEETSLAELIDGIRVVDTQ